MSDDPVASSFDDDDLPYAPLRPSWRDQVGPLAESFGLTPGRVVAVLVALAVAAAVAWRLLAPATTPAEMSLPYTKGASPGDASPAGAGTVGAEPAAPGRTGAATGGTGPAGNGAPLTTDPAAGAGGGASTRQPGEVVVHVAGAVARPGVQRLGTGARVVDAVDGAGGATPDAEVARINLAAPLQDGQQVYVPRVGEPAPAPAPGEPGEAGGPVNLNTATAEQLETLPGVGPATAEAIIAHREAEGPFTSVDQLLDVRGIGDAKLAAVRDLVAV